MHGVLLRASSLAALGAGLLLAAPAASTQQSSVRLPEKDKPLALRIAPVFAVGKAEGRDWEMFNNVEQVVFDRNDNLYVLDGGSTRVLVFDRSGRFVRQIGKKGGGPGEFAYPLGLAVSSNGTLVVSDLGHRSYSMFGPDGKYLRSIPFTDEWVPVPMNARMAAHPRGGVVAPARPSPLLGMGGPMRGPSGQSMTPIVWQPFQQGAKPFTLFNTASQVKTETEASSPREGQRTVNFRATIPSFAPPLAWDLLPGGGLVVAHTPGYTLKVVGANGRIARYIQKPQRVRKVTERDRERERDQMREQMRTGEGLRIISIGPGVGGGRQTPSREAIEEEVSRMEFNDVIPAIQDLRTDAAGRIWVHRTGAIWGEPGPIDIVTADGRYLGTLTGQRLPDAFSASGRVAYIQTDDEGVERVVVRQLPRF